MKIPSPGKLILGHLNINSVRNKSEALKYIIDNNIDLLLISEVKLDAACNFVKKETLAELFSCEFCQISKRNFFAEHLWMTASIEWYGFRLRWIDVDCCANQWTGF